MAKSVKLINGATMPLVGLGTWQSSPEVVKAAVIAAIDAGYKHIDTAYAYSNEAAIGEALKEKFQQGVKREDLFITTKLHVQFMNRGAVTEGIKESLANLGLSYVDLYLIHGPVGMKRVPGKLFPVENGKLQTENIDHLETWKGMEDVFRAGLTKAIGLSNFNERQIRRIYDAAEIKPDNLQVECHAYFRQQELQDFCKKLNISFTAYAPIGSPGRSGALFSDTKFKILLEDPKLNKIAKAHNKSPAQVALRYLVQRNICVIPKSVTPERIRQNIDIYDFELSKEEMNTLNHLEVNERTFTADQFGTDHPEFPFEHTIKPSSQKLFK